MNRMWIEWLRTGPLCAGLLLLACQSVVAGGQEVGPELLDAIPAADVVILGEIHDNAAHHSNQARAVRAMAPAALVFEMFGPDAASRLEGEMPYDAEAMSKALGWDESGWPDFALYFPIFEAAPEAAVYGGAPPAADVRRAVTEGAATVMGPDAARFGLDRALEADELAIRVTLQREAHCDAMPEELLPGMVEAQRLRDAGLAHAAITALEDTGGPVAVITGNGHARTDWGVPRMLGRALVGVSVLSLGQFEEPPMSEVPYDHWLVTDPADREDPCAAFR